MLIASALALLAGLSTIACLRFGVLTTDLLAPFHSTNTVILSFDGEWGRTLELALLAVCLIAAVSLQRWGLSRTWPFVLAAGVLLTGTDYLFSRFASVALPVVPFVFATPLTLCLVQLNRLWYVDRKLRRVLFGSATGLRFINAAEVSARLNNGLKLLNTVLALHEAVVFQYSNSGSFQLVARLKSQKSANSDPSRNAVWRDGVRLCEKAVANGEFIIQPTEGSQTTNVAVPLSHEGETVGVLLLRLAADFCQDDRALLQAVGSQFARNLNRHNFTATTPGIPALNYFSATSNETKLGALHVLNSAITEQRCEANALGSVDDGIAIAYLDGTLALTNIRLQDFIGVTNEQLKSLDLFSLLDHLRTGVFDEPALAVRRVLQTGIDYESELAFPDKNQTLGLRLSLLREKSPGGFGEPIGLAVYVRELSRAKEYEKLKSDMISLMSHELRTPLTSINGFAELLTADDSIPEQAREFVTIIANESQRMSRMINTFLAVTQLQRKDKQEVLKIPLRLDEVVHDTIMTLQPVAKRKRIRLVEQPAQRVPPVAADKSLITQAVKNLVNNAIKYSPERTTVTVSTALEAETVRVCVEDRGFGIPSESRERVWEKFYRVVREGQEKDEESTGLGLSFVREVIEQHGGNVELDSEEGRGSKFSFTLPRL